jgi:hypothetical protein
MWLSLLYTFRTRGLCQFFFSINYYLYIYIYMHARALTPFDFHRKWSYWLLQPGKQHVPLSRVSFIKRNSLCFGNLTFHITNLSVDAALDLVLFYLAPGSFLMACYRLRQSGTYHISFLK